jgi:GDP-L-fucose synthase
VVSAPAVIQPASRDNPHAVSKTILQSTLHKPLDRASSVYVAGHRGVVGQAIVRRLRLEGFSHLILRTHSEVDLTSAEQVEAHFRATRPSVVIIAAARVGGIAANIAAPVEFLVENLAIQNNVLLACHRHGVDRTVFLGSSCIYPREAPQPMREECFMHGPLEPTNESYAVAKIAGIRLAQSLFEQHGMRALCPMPCNVYGPGDHFEFERSHVVSALVRRFCEARASGAPSITLWGTGTARREFVHSDDLARACLFLLQHHDAPDIINVGSGVDHSIAELADMVARIVGYQGAIDWDRSRPDGMPRKLLDVSRIRALGWRHRVELEDGLEQVVADFRQRYLVAGALPA